MNPICTLFLTIAVKKSEVFILHSFIDSKPNIKLGNVFHWRLTPMSNWAIMCAIRH